MKELDRKSFKLGFEAGFKENIYYLHIKYEKAPEWAKDGIAYVLWLLMKMRESDFFGDLEERIFEETRREG